MSDMIEVKTAELIGVALDYAVFRAVGVFPHGILLETPWPKVRQQEGYVYVIDRLYLGDTLYSPSTNWSQGGPLIEKYCMEVVTMAGQFHAVTNRGHSTVHYVDVYEEDFEGCGTTHLVAVCRAIVASKLGDTVQVPREGESDA